MESAKQAIKDFTSKAGHHDTTVTEHHAPAVTHEHVTPTTHEQATTVIDREVHQDHHHTSVVPVHDREVLPETHKHNVIPVEHKKHEHGDHRGVQERLAAEAAQFKDVSKTGETQHSHELKPTVAGEHVHHHVHETIQPVIQKETIQPTVIHTTIPVHEVHHNEPKHHAASALQAISMADFKKQGGSLTGRADQTEHFEGEPRTESAQQHSGHAGSHRHGVADSTAVGAAGTGAGTGIAGATGAGTSGRDRELGSSKIDPRVDPQSGAATRTSATTGTNTTGTVSSASRAADSLHEQPNSGSAATTQYADTHAGSKMDTAGDRGLGGNALNTNQHASNFEAANVTKSSGSPTDASATGAKKPSLLDRLNPLKDSDGDGKKGIMS